VARDVNEARNLRKLVREQDRQGALGHVQGEHALAKLDHGHADESLEEIYAREGAAPRPWLPTLEEPAAEPPPSGDKTGPPSAGPGEEAPKQ
jgi:hypothetical protein